MTELAAVLATRRREHDDEIHRPLPFDASRADDRDALLALLASRPEIVVLDTLADQLTELVETRHVAGKLTPAERESAVIRHLAGRDRSTYGTWFFYPWARRLVHLLPADEFDELRLSRNRNKITTEEQARLRKLDVLVVGLSVGRASAVTLALEGVCGRLRLADFDLLELSNLNRIRDSVFGLGSNKAVLASREIAEIDPYLDVEIHPHGVRPDTLDAMLSSPRVDLVIEECDDLEMKLRIRERARALGIAVVMETSDRGMLDVERFDLEPDRPIFHGLVGDLRAESLRGLDTYRKVPHILRIIGADTMSMRMAASLVDVETTLKTWPQLASAVALGGALNAEAVRRIGLGGLRESGRYYTDVDKTLARPAAQGPTPAVDSTASRDVTLLECPPMPVVGDDWRTWAKFLVAHATLAPSGGNAQPWRFKAAPREIRCVVDPGQWPTMLDFGGRASVLACGAAAANFSIAAEAAGRPWRIDWGPEDGTLAWRTWPDPERTSAVDPGRLRALVERCSNRHVGTRRPLTDEESSALQGSVTDASVVLRSDDAAMHELGEILAAGDRIRMLHQRLHRELVGELRWSPAEVLATGDGIDLATLELDATQRAAIALSRQWPLMSTLRESGGGGGLGRGSRLAAAQAAGFAMLRTAATGRSAVLRGGFALTHLWLRAESLGLAVQPMTALLFLFDRIEATGDGEDANRFDATDSDALRVLRGRLHALFGVAQNSDLILLRLARAPRPTARSVRRGLDIALQFHDH